MAKITITGASDDLVEIEGDITEEFDCYEQPEGTAIAVSDGTLLSVRYDSDGIWRFSLLASGSASFSKVEGDAEKETNDIVTLDGDICWVALTKAHVRKTYSGKQVAAVS